MANVISAVVTKNVPVKNAAGEEGKDIGFIYGQFEPFSCSVDLGQEHDGWVPMVNPPVWRDTGQVGWLKKSWCIEDKPGVTQVLVTFYDDGTPPTMKVIS